MELWSRLRAFSQSVKIESLSFGPVRIKFDLNTLESGPYSKLCSLVKVGDLKFDDILAVSAHNVDELTMVDRIDADHECEALGSASRSAGGSGANTAYMLARLGATARAAGIVGNDFDGRFLLKSLSEAGVNTDLIVIDDSDTSGRTTTLVEHGGKRFIAVYPGVNNKFAQRHDHEALIRAATASKIVHLSSFVGQEELHLQERIVREIAGRTLISLSPGALYARLGLDRLSGIIAQVSIIFLYREQLEQLIYNSSAKNWGRDVRTQVLMGAFFDWKLSHNITSPQILVVKDKSGHGGELINQQFLSVGVGSTSLEQYFPPRDLPRAMKFQTVDTTGSGDAAAAGFLYGLLNSAPIEQCIDSALLMACFASTSLGARTAFFESYEQVLQSGESIVRGLISPGR